jgi:hypothetical protein
MSEQHKKVKAVADIVFLVDVTGSMQPFIDMLKDHISKFIESLTTGGGPNDPPPVKDWRGMVVGYRDFPDNPDDWFETNGFINDADQLRDNIASLTASGGGDKPESLLDAIHKIALFDYSAKDEAADSMKWRSPGSAHRFIIAFTDAVYHPIMSYEDGEGAGVDAVIDACETSKIKLCVFTPGAEGGDDAYEELSTLDGSEIELLDGKDSQEAFDEFVAMPDKFASLMSNLAKTVSKSVDAAILDLPDLSDTPEEDAAESDEGIEPPSLPSEDLDEE